MAVPANDPDAIDDMLDPHREEERESAAMELTGRLAQKGVDINSEEDPGQLADLLSAVEEFERAVEEAGGDLMVNTPDSVDPESRAFVVPERRGDEPIARYRERVLAAARALKG